MFIKDLLLFSCSVLSISLQPHELQHTRLPCPSRFPGFCSNSCHWISDAIQPSHAVFPFSSCLQSFLASGSFPMNRLFALDSQIIGTSASASVLPVNIHDWFTLGWTGLTSLQSNLAVKTQESSPTPQFKSINSSVLSFLHSTTLTSIHDHWKNQ